jgi:hypothetical protein
VADPAERARLWPLIVDMYHGFHAYQQRTQREIPLILLEKRSGS